LAADFVQRCIAEDDEWGHASLFGEGLAPAAEGVEELEFGLAEIGDVAAWTRLGE
jgi:hypothetical protein